MKNALFIILFLLPFTSLHSQEVVGKPEPLCDNADTKPSFPGGLTAMSEFFQKNLKYPELEREGQVSGTCYVAFVVEKDGSITGVMLLRGISGGPGCDKEAMRVVQSMPKWTPGKKDGNAVRVMCNLPVKFTLTQPTAKEKK